MVRSDETRQAIVDLGDPRLAFYYSDEVDRYPRKDLREVACKSPRYAYHYAKYVDYNPRKETREAVSGDDYYSREYKYWEGQRAWDKKRRQKKK